MVREGILLSVVFLFNFFCEFFLGILIIFIIDVLFLFFLEVDIELEVEVEGVVLFFNYYLL